MSGHGRVLAVIPARGGSKGLPGKNVRPFMGLPLIAHTIQFARMCPEIARCIVSTDSEEIAQVSRQYQGDVPFLRPPELASDDIPMWPVLQHALAYVEEEESAPYDLLLLLDPTSPSREPTDITEALRRLGGVPEADGVIGVSQPAFNPIWHCVVEKDGWMTYLVQGGEQFERRQEVPAVYRINGSLYIWRAPLLRRPGGSWHQLARQLIYEIPDYRANSIDTLVEFERYELLVKHGLIPFPWLHREARAANEAS